MEVCHIAESDGIGGACKAAYKLHAALSDLGVSSRMIVKTKVTNDASVTEISASSLISLSRGAIKKKARKRRFKPYKKTRANTLELFTDGQGVYGHDLANQLPEAPVYALHWNAELVDYYKLFAKLGRNHSLLWRLSDQNPMTGGCHYALECDRFEHACGACPQLGSQREIDLTRRVFERKRAALEHLDPARVRIIAPSRWMRASVERSSLLSRFSCQHIATGVDTKRFSPRAKTDARRRLDLPEDRPTIVFVAQSLRERRKGFDLLINALKGLQMSPAPLLVSVGEGDAEAFEHLGLEHVALGRLDSAERLADAYSAGDVFVMPSRADNLPNVILEAIACGTPVVGFNIGGIPDVVRDGISGFVAPAGNISSMREGIERILTNSTLRKALSASSRNLALREFDSSARVLEYRNLIAELAATNG